MGLSANNSIVQGMFEIVREDLCAIVTLYPLQLNRMSIDL